MKIFYSSTPIVELRTNKVRATASLAHLQLDYVLDTNPPVLHKLFRPSLPILATPSGVAVSSANNIIRYIANSFQKLYGHNIQEASQIDQWLDIISFKLEPAIENIVQALQNKDICVQKAVKDARLFLRDIEKHLKNSKYLVGAELSIADVSLYTNLTVIYTYLSDEDGRKLLPGLEGWFKLVGQQIGNGLSPAILGKNIHPRFINLTQTVFTKPIDLNKDSP